MQLRNAKTRPSLPQGTGISRAELPRLDLIVIKFLAGYANKPIYVFGGFGIAALGVSLLAGLYALYLKFVEGTAFILTPRSRFIAPSLTEKMNSRCVLPCAGR